ncbi:hypothetical protein [Streptomyces jumonjinensis]|uniref:hypothetical protein n=1 Tax=Streptomyces jumonjinensis TaxID=1945 RepID=UPI00379E2492
MTRYTRAMVPAVLLLALVTGCGSAPDPDKPAAAASTPTKATSSAPVPEPTEEPTEEPIAEPTRDIGQAWEYEGTIADEEVEGSEAVLGYAQGVRSIVSADEDAGTTGYEWAAVELKSCSVKGSFYATTMNWTLSYEDGSRIEPSSTTYDDFPKPEYPVETKLTAGKCVKGKVVFAVPAKERPATIVYAPDSVEIPLEWTVPAK